MSSSIATRVLIGDADTRSNGKNMERDFRETSDKMTR